MRFDLNDREWAIVEPLLPTDVRGKPRVDDRRVLNGIFYVLRTHCPWRDLPERYGPRMTVYNRFNRWAKRGVWEPVFAALAVKSGPAAHRGRPEAVRLQQYLDREFAAQPLHNRLMALWTGAVPEAARKSTLDDLWRKQSSDGSWTLDALGPWSKHEKAPPSTGASAYATAFTAAALRAAGVSGPRLALALEWLKSHQDPKGYWDAVSMNKPYAPDSMMSGFMRDAATAYAALALAGGI